MTDTAPNAAKVKALELANIHTAEPAKVVERANAYHAFLTGAAAAPAGAATTAKTTPAANNKPAADANKGATAGAGAGKGATTGKPDANKGATAGAGKGATTGKPDANKGAATGNKPAANGASAGAVAPDTKAPGGKHTYAEVVAKLRDVQQKINREEAFKILAEDGAGAKSVRELKPAQYDAVVEGCNNALSDEGGAGAADDGLGGNVEDPTAQEPRDELGM